MKNTKKIILGIVGIAFSGILIYAVFNLTDWAEIWRLMLNASSGWLICSALAIQTGCLLRAIRWKIISGSLQTTPLLFWKIVILGYLGNFLLPLRAGEAIRIWLLIRLRPMKPAAAIISSLADRTTDILLVSAVAVLAIIIAPIPAQVENIKLVIFLFLFIGLLALLIFVFSRSLIDTAISFLTSSKKIFLIFLGRFLNEFNNITKNILFERPVSIVFLLTCIAVLDLAGITFVMLALNWEIPIVSSTVFLVVLAFGSMLPSAPGFLGIYQVAAIVSFGIYGINPTEAVAYSLLLQGLTAFSYFVMGSLALLSISPHLLENKKLK